MTDWFRIGEFIDAGAASRVTGMYSGGPRVNLGTVLSLARKFAERAARHVLDVGSRAAKDHNTVIVTTHIPPFEDAHVHNGVKGSPEAMPWYTSRFMGDALMQLAEEYPSVMFQVLCGHTHGRKSVEIRHNLACHVGGAEYGSPVVNTVEIA